MEAKELFDDFLNYKPREDLEQFSKIPTEVWLKIGEQKALENFHIVAKAVPAYRDFLTKSKVDPEKIKTIEDFKQLPLTTKENYFKKYPLDKLVMGGDISKASVIHYSSGSAGKSLFWPKSVVADLNTYKGVELLLTNYFNIDKVNSLLINCFAMGPWPAGEIVHTASKMIGDKGVKLSVISPGTNIDLFFSIFNGLASSYDQVLISGYPSFLKDLADESLKRRTDFSSHDIKLLTGGEVFSENWRRFMARVFKFKREHWSVSSVLGTSESGVTSISTPFTDYFRIYLSKNKKVIQKFFDSEDLPSITQYIPPARHVEIVKSETIVTGMGFVPLIRYNSNDFGKIIQPSEIFSVLPESFQRDFKTSNKNYSIPQLPILTISGRSDRTLIVRGANVYSEQISYVLDLPEFQKDFTGKFISEKTESEDGDSVIKITLQLASKRNKHLISRSVLSRSISKELAKINSEYANALATSGNKVLLLVEIKEYGAVDFEFRSGKGFSVKT